MRDCGIYFHRNVDRVRRIPVTVNDQNAGGNRGKRRGCEVHVIIAVFHGMVLPPQLPELVVPVFMVLSHDLLINVGPAFPDPPAQDSPCLFRKVMHGSTNQNHGLDPGGLLSRHMQEGYSADAHAHRLKPPDSQPVEQREHVKSTLPKSELLGGVVDLPCPRRSGMMS